MTLVEKDCWII